MVLSLGPMDLAPASCILPRAELSLFPWLWFWRDRGKRMRKDSRNEPLKYRVWGLTPSSGWLCHLLMAMVQSIIRFLKSSCPTWRNP
jgi:hypothetical protein